ncbi:MAG: hypothetical protein LBT66_07440 [Methanobrevibacter sp.]|nr:hypothetical protein [Candidatus Methanovirga meridionalis]
MSVRVHIENLADMGFPLNDFWINDDMLILFPVSCTVSYCLYNKLVSYGFKCILSDYLTMVSIKIVKSPSNTFDQIIEYLEQEVITL